MSSARGYLRATWWLWRAVSSAITLATVAWFDAWARVLENEATVGRGFGGQLRGDAVDKRRFHATGGVAAAAAWSGVGRQEGQDRARADRKPVGLAGDKRAAMTLVMSRIRPMPVARSALSGIAGHYSGHPIRTRFVLADDAGTVHALALVAGGGSVWSVERLQRLVGASRFGQPGRLWIEAKLLVYLRSAVIAGPFEAVSRCGQPGSLS